jgi:hypothetical protein
MDIGTVTAGAGAFKAGMDAIQALKNLVSGEAAAAKITDIQTALINAQQSAIEAQTAHSTDIARVRELEEKMRAFETWDSEKARYELKKHPDANVMTYALKEGMQPSEPPHEICPDCYQRRIKSILQHVTRHPGYNSISLCQQCGWEAYIAGSWQPEHGGTKSASRRPR